MSQPPQPEPEQPPNKSTNKGGIWGLLAGAALFIALIASCSAGGSEPEDTNSVGAAVVNCHESVRKQLKAPSTAKFHDGTKTKAGNTWTVTGTVDSQNSFGAMLTVGWSCTADESGGLATLDE